MGLEAPDADAWETQRRHIRVEAIQLAAELLTTRNPGLAGVSTIPGKAEDLVYVADWIVTGLPDTPIPPIGISEQAFQEAFDRAFGPLGADCSMLGDDLPPAYPTGAEVAQGQPEGKVSLDVANDEVEPGNVEQPNQVDSFDGLND